MPEPHEPGDRTPAQRQADHASLARLSETLVPALVAKLTGTGLGEVEVREGDWRIRVRRPLGGRRRRPPRPAAASGPRLGGRRLARRSPARRSRPRPQRPRTRIRRDRHLARRRRLPARRRRRDGGPRRRPDRHRRPARHPPGRHGADRRRRSSRCSRRPARPSSTARRSRSSRRSPSRRRAAGDEPARPAGRPERGQPDPHREPGRDRAARSCAPAARSGIEAVVAYSEADRESLAPMLADEAICIGPADAKRSYLSAPAIISAALVTGCDAIHPGYGFLSEDDAFADAVRAHDLTFIGPSAHVLERFASKEETRRLLAAHGLPTIPGLRPAARRGAGARGGGAGRLPGARQAVRGRRRQGHADGALAARARGRAADLPLRGTRRVRRRLAVPRALAPGQPPRRGPGRGRPVRARRPPLGARLLRPAPAPEDPRGDAPRPR